MPVPGRNISSSATGGRGHLRASHADRDQAIGTLATAFVQGRLDKDEFDERVGHALESRTYAELAGLTADLPDGLADLRPRRPPVPWQSPPPVSKPLLWFSVAITLLAAVSAATAFMVDDGVAFVLVMLSVFVFLLAAPVSAGLIYDSRQCKRRGRPAPARPGGQRPAQPRPPLPAQPGPLLPAPGPVLPAQSRVSLAAQPGRLLPAQPRLSLPAQPSPPRPAQHGSSLPTQPCRPLPARSGQPPPRQEQAGQPQQVQEQAGQPRQAPGGRLPAAADDEPGPAGASRHDEAPGRRITPPGCLA
jgi:hypothetical protein